jgi:thiol:disulfide interchange protein
MMIKSLALALSAVLVAGTAVAAPAPQMGIASFAELATPLPTPYDDAKAPTGKDADAAVAKAKAQARREHKLLLIDLGGDWCGDCRVLAGTIERPELKAFVDQHYVLVSIAVGRRIDQNLQIPGRYHVDAKAGGVPNLLVVDPRTNKLMDAGHTAALEDARHMTPQALADWLAQWTG